MTALTGETGAGKTLLVEALELLVGGRADPALVRPGATEALVEGRFVVDDDEVILARPFPPGPVAGLGRRPHGPGGGAGRGRGTACSTCTASTPTSRCSTLGAQRRALDAFAGIDLGPLSVGRGPGDARSRPSSTRWAATSGPGPASRPAALPAREIDAAGLPDPTRTTARPPRRTVWPQAAAHREAAAAGSAALDAGDGEGRSRPWSTCSATARAGALAGRHPAGRAGRSAWPSLQADAADAASELRHVVETWEDDPERLDRVRARRQLLRELSRKYGEGPPGSSPSPQRRAGVWRELDAAEVRAAALAAELAAARGRAGRGRGGGGRSAAPPRPPRSPPPWRSACGPSPCPMPGSR